MTDSNLLIWLSEVTLLGIKNVEITLLLNKQSIGTIIMIMIDFRKYGVNVC